jgi:hypothetical protein
MKPDQDLCLSWRSVIPGGGNYGPTEAKRVAISDQRTIRVFWITDPLLMSWENSRTHDRIRYECGRWKLTLLSRRATREVSFDRFEGDFEHFNRDTLHAKLCGVFDS